MICLYHEMTLGKNILNEDESIARDLIVTILVSIYHPNSYIEIN
jgi:hypothetical protein